MPSTTTGFLASSVVTTHRGLAARFFDLRDGRLLLNQKDSSCHIPHTGIAWGLASGHMVTIQ